jgi:hypothetical protein
MRSFLRAFSRNRSYILRIFHTLHNLDKNIYISNLLVSVLTAALLSGTNLNPKLLTRADGDYGQVYENQRDILETLHDQVQDIIPKLCACIRQQSFLLTIVLDPLGHG